MQDQNQNTQNMVSGAPIPQGMVQSGMSNPAAGAAGVNPAMAGVGTVGQRPPVPQMPQQIVASQAAAQQPAVPQLAAKQPTAQQNAAQQAKQAANRATSKAAQSAFVRKIVDKIRNSENILVALSRDPSVDEMAAAIGLTLFLDGLQKHTTAIYSGETPDALAFLQPEGTFETNTDSLRDFIIALSKDKADHLRYKLDGDFVKVYITPYKTTLNEEDLEFSYGDFNVNLVLGLGIPSAGDLDEALSEYGRIMHDATTVDITVDVPGKFAEIEWSDPSASSVSEMITKLIFTMQGQDAVLDKDVATALLTGIVAATGRFSNDKTNSETMQLASKLMSMGADQQLISANVMDNSGNRPNSGNEYAAPEVDETNLLVGQDYNFGGVVPAEAEVSAEVASMPQMTTATVANESPIIEPVIPDLLKKTETDRAAMQAAAMAAVNEAVTAATANAAAAGATGMGIPQAQVSGQGQNFGQNSDQAQATTQVGYAAVQPVVGGEAKDYAQMMEQALAENDGVGAPSQPVSSQAVEQNSGAGGAQGVPAGAEQKQTPMAEPVAKDGGVVLPPPPEPGVPNLSDVQAQTNAGQDGAFRIPGA